MALLDDLGYENPLITDKAANNPLEPIMNVLSLLRRPFNAMTTGINEGMNNGIGAGLLGAWEGLSGQKETSWGDILGIPEGNESDDWGKWLGKEGLRLGLDAVFDPMNLLFGVGAISKGLGAAKTLSNGKTLSAASRIAKGLGSEELTNKLANTQLYKTFARKLPDTELYSAIEPGIMRAQSTAGAGLGDLRTLLDTHGGNIQGAMDDLLANVPKEQTSSELLKLYDALESGAWKGTQYEGYANAIAPLKGYRDVIRKTLQEEAAKHGQELADITLAPGQEFMPHVRTLKTKLFKADMPAENLNMKDSKGFFFSKPPVSVDELQQHRNLMKWLDEEGNPILIQSGEHAGKPLIAEAGRGTIVDVSKSPYTKDYRYGGQKVTPEQASLMEKTVAVKPEDWVLNPVEALLLDIKDMVNKQSFLGSLEHGGTSTGALKKLPIGALPEAGEQYLKIPGLKDYVAKDSAIASRFENMARGIYGDSVEMPWFVELLNKATKSPAGGALDAVTNSWKRGTLPLSPGWHAGNFVSDLFNMSMEQSPLTIPGNILQGKAIRKGLPGEALPGLTNEAMNKEMLARQVLSSGSVFSDELNTKPAGIIQGLMEKLGAPNYIKAPVTKVTDAIRSANDWGLEQGAKGEADRRIADVLAYIKPKWNESLPEAEKAKLLDAAVLRARNTLIDNTYSNIPQFEKDLAKVMPFYNWTRGMVAKTAEGFMKYPQKLGRTELALERIFDPLPENQQATADDWIRESAPVKGIRGLGSFDEIADKLGLDRLPRGERMALLGRYLPWGTVEQAVHRPMDSFMSMMNPYLKAPYELIANKNSFKNRPIDAIAGGFPMNIINPLIGRDYEPSPETWFGGYQPSSGGSYIMSIMPFARHFNEVQQLGNGLLWDQDPYKPEMSGPEKALWYLSGGKAFPYDQMRMEQHRQKELAQKMAAIKSVMSYGLKAGADPAVQKALDMMIANSGAMPGRGFWY